MITFRALAGFVVAVSALTLSAAGQPDSPPAPHIYYYKTPKPLTPNPALIAVFTDTAQRAARAPHSPLNETGLPNSRIPAAAVVPHVIKGWSLINTESMQPDPARPVTARDQVAHLAADADLDFVSPVFVDDLGGPLIITPDLFIALDPALTREQAEAIFEQTAAGRIVEENYAGLPGVWKLRTENRDAFGVIASIESLIALPEVRFAEPDLIFTGKSALTPNDPGYINCWGLHNTTQLGGINNMDMDAPEAWDITIGSPDIKVVIIDTGAQQDHPDINQVPGIDTTSEEGSGGPLSSFDNHGTPVAGCVSAIINNSLGTVGIAPGCKSASARTFIGINSQGNWSAQTSWTVDTLTWAESIAARVTNNSNSYGTSSALIDLKYAQTRADGMVHFASAGNNATFDAIVYPARLPSVMAIAALTPSGVLANFSNWGPGLFISAPGTLVYTTDRTGTAGYSTGNYTFIQGTSFSSPYAAGVAALVLSYNPILTAADVESILASSAKDLGTPGFDSIFGWGFINAFTALLITPPQGPPDFFFLTSPSNGQTQVLRRPTFEWLQSLGAFRYEFVLDDDADFSSPHTTQTISGSTSFTLTAPLDVSTTYYWKVTAENSLGATLAYPEAASFTTINTPPAGFALTAPAANATGVSLTPSFAWAAADTAESYHFTLDDDADFTSPISDVTTISNSFAQIDQLAPVTTYYWRVEAINGVGPTGSTPAASQFTTLLAPPTSFELLTPADGQIISTTTPTFAWNASGGASSYSIEITTSFDFSSIEFTQSDITGTSITIPAGTLTNNVFYFWRMSSHNPAGSAAATPAVASFAISVPPCQGDSNQDGSVNFTDLTTTLLYWGISGRLGDANLDNNVNFIDVTTILERWGQSCQ